MSVELGMDNTRNMHIFQPPPQTIISNSLPFSVNDRLKFALTIYRFNISSRSNIIVNRPTFTFV